MKCPKCSYERKAADQAPDYECPNCGIIYDKYRPPNASAIISNSSRETKSQTDNIDSISSAAKKSNIQQWIIPIFIGLVVGYFSGREHIKYELRQTFQATTEEISRNFSNSKNNFAFTPNNSKSTSQGNAIRSAKQYINISGFSRAGLIKQLSSDAGDGYSTADATAAVDSLNIDWNSQATRSARQYLSISGFSCKGLIEQLSSTAGDGYTESQAIHGAQQAGAC